MHQLFLLCLKDCFRDASTVPVVSDGMCSFKLRGLQADLNGGSGGDGAAPSEKQAKKDC